MVSRMRGPGLSISTAAAGLWRLVLLWVLPVLLAACAGHPHEPPLVIHEDAHRGGTVVAFSQSGDLLASGGWSGTVQLWRLPEGSALRRWKGHSDSVNGIAFLESDRQIVTAGYDGVLARRGLNGELQQRIADLMPITHMDADAATDRLVTGHHDGTVRLWKASDFTLLDEQRLHKGAVKAVAIDPRRTRFASSSTDGTVAVWAESGTVTYLDEPPTDGFTLAFSPDGQWLSGGSWFRLYRWNLEDGSLTTLATEHYGIIKAVQYTDEGASLASISRQTDSSVYFLDPISGKVTRRFQRHDLCGADISVSPDGRYLATTSDDASVRIWALGE
jgi:WD40 repeat protein